MFIARNSQRYSQRPVYENRYKSGLLFVFMSERRAAHRHRVLKGGAIELSGGGTISRAVKNLLAAGRL
jgi:hypothetical protein